MKCLLLHTTAPSSGETLLMNDTLPKMDVRLFIKTSQNKDYFPNSPEEYEYELTTRYNYIITIIEINSK